MNIGGRAKTSRTLICVVFVTLTAPVSSGAALASPTPTCAQVLSLYELGPALTVAQVEAKSINEMKASRGVPQVPFGHINGEWVALKALIRPGDTLHEFKTDLEGGYLLVRDGCRVAQITSWIR